MIAPVAERHEAPAEGIKGGALVRVPPLLGVDRLVPNLVFSPESRAEASTDAAQALERSSAGDATGREGRGPGGGCAPRR